MSGVIRAINSKLEVAARAYRIGPSLAKGIALFPAAIVLLYGFFMVLPPTRSIALLTLEESHLIETLTFVFLLLGGVLGLAWARRTKKLWDEVLVTGFYAVVSIGLLLIAMEEVAWGQHLLGFETPSTFERVNKQGEVTLHNIGAINNRTEFLRLAFGLCGLLGVWASSRPRFRKVGVPVILLPWFPIIIVLAGLDLYNDYYPIQARFDIAIEELSELVEMLIAISVVLFIWLNARMLSFRAEGSSRSRPVHPQS